MTGVDDWPAWATFGLTDDIRPALSAARAGGETVAIVTLFHSEGGSPRGLGAQMAVGAETLVGHVSGGCIEGDVAAHCARVIASKVPQRLVYGRGGPWDLPLPCGGRIELLIEAVAPEDPALNRLLAFADARKPCVWISDGRVRRCVADDEVALPKAEAGPTDGAVFRRFDPRARLVIVGSDPTALAMVALAATMEIDAVLVRPLGPPSPPPLAGVRYARERPAEALALIGIDRWTAVAACTHDADLDGETLMSALRSPAFFVGALGSARRRTDRLEALRAAGMTEIELARLCTPIGLSIGARTPYEIAVATLAEIVAAQRIPSAERRARAA